MESDEELIALHLAGDESAFARLVERHLVSAYSFTLRLVGDRNDAEDIVQESFLKAWKNIARYRSESALFKTWFMRIVRNSAVDHLRRRKSLPFSSFETDREDAPFTDIPDTAPLAEELLSRKYDAKEVERAVRELPPKQREILLLYYGSAIRLEEVAAIVGLPLNTVKSRHHRAILALRKLLHRT